MCVLQKEMDGDIQEVGSLTQDAAAPVLAARDAPVITMAYCAVAGLHFGDAVFLTRRHRQAPIDTLNF